VTPAAIRLTATPHTTAARNILRKSHITKCSRSTGGIGDALLFAQISLIVKSSVLFIDPDIWRREAGNFGVLKVTHCRPNVAGRWHGVSITHWPRGVAVYSGNTTQSV
jgi:hypothetical protein